MLTKRGYNDNDMDKWEYWRFQYTIDIILKIQEEKDNNTSINNLNTL
jgi:hypothetical protein